ncbi:hypothetical protein [Burkholderia cenocepacia]|uniref:hypothetical protein n=1 Tax=Burkholderia cenocepacia TaxID=95486 RepID=UPI0011777CF2|nr:hypothetical protein [Burkholderia cenocepacia]
MSIATNNKKMHGQFYTISNPFHSQLFLSWFKSIENYSGEILLEPFAGANNIVDMVKKFTKNDWDCYDIQPNNELNKVPKYQIIQQDTLKNFPQGYRISITNPPYLAKNSATKSGLDFPDTEYDDIYKLALSKLLDNVDYIAAIIPDSFLTQNLFHDRLYGVATLNCKMFEDTECPVCLALFVPEEDKKKKGLDNDFHYYKGDIPYGKYSELQAQRRAIEIANKDLRWKFNAPKGEIGLYAIDGTSDKTIRFVEGKEIPSAKVKHTSRCVTRISGLPSNMETKDLIKEANQVLCEFRENTNDIFMTSFRGLRKDGDYRRRLDFSLAKAILNFSYNRLGGFHA